MIPRGTRRWRVFLLAIALTQISAGQQLAGWRLVLGSDEFDGTGGSPVDSSKWTLDKGDGSPRNPGWGNHELQSYSDSTRRCFS